MLLQFHDEFDKVQFVRPQIGQRRLGSRAGSLHAQLLGGETHRKLGFFPLAGGVSVPANSPYPITSDLFGMDAATGNLVRRGFSGSTPGAGTVVPTGVDWRQASGAFALNILGKGQQAMAYAFFKPAEKQGDKISGEPYRAGSTGAPILANAPAFVECRLVDSVERGDHSIFVGEVVDAGVSKTPEGRADDATLWLKDLGATIFYGG